MAVGFQGDAKGLHQGHGAFGREGHHILFVAGEKGDFDIPGAGGSLRRMSDVVLCHGWTLSSVDSLCGERPIRQSADFARSVAHDGVTCDLCATDDMDWPDLPGRQPPRLDRFADGTLVDADQARCFRDADQVGEDGGALLSLSLFTALWHRFPSSSV